MIRGLLFHIPPIPVISMASYIELLAGLCDMYLSYEHHFIVVVISRFIACLFRMLPRVCRVRRMILQLIVNLAGGLVVVVCNLAGGLVVVVLINLAG
jgi:hypothetical protein